MLLSLWLLAAPPAPATTPAPPKSDLAFEWRAGLAYDDNPFLLSPSQETKLRQDDGSSDRFAAMPSVTDVLVDAGGGVTSAFRLGGHRTNVRAALDANLYLIDTAKTHARLDVLADTKLAKGQRVFARVRVDPRQFKKNYFLGPTDNSQPGDTIGRQQRHYGHGTYLEDSLELGVRLGTGKTTQLTASGIFRQEHWHPVTNRSVNALGGSLKVERAALSLRDQLELDRSPNHDELLLLPCQNSPCNGDRILGLARVDHSYLENDLSPGLAIALSRKADLDLAAHWTFRPYLSSNAGDPYKGRVDQKLGLDAAVSLDLVKKTKLELFLSSDRKLTHQPNAIGGAVAEDVDYQHDAVGASVRGEF